MRNRRKPKFNLGDLLCTEELGYPRCIVITNIQVKNIIDSVYHFHHITGNRKDFMISLIVDHHYHKLG